MHRVELLATENKAIRAQVCISFSQRNSLDLTHQLRVRTPRLRVLQLIRQANPTYVSPHIDDSVDRRPAMRGSAPPGGTILGWGQGQSPRDRSPILYITYII